MIKTIDTPHGRRRLSFISQWLHHWAQRPLDFEFPLRVCRRLAAKLRDRNNVSTPITH